MMIPIPAFKGRGSVEELTFFDSNGNEVDWNAAGIITVDGSTVQITAARFYAGGAFVSATLHSAGRIRFKPGLLDIPPRQYQAQLVVYGIDDTEGTVIAGPNLPNSLLLNLVP